MHKLDRLVVVVLQDIQIIVRENVIPETIVKLGWLTKQWWMKLLKVTPELLNIKDHLAQIYKSGISLDPNKEKLLSLRVVSSSTPNSQERGITAGEYIPPMIIYEKARCIHT